MKFKDSFEIVEIDNDYMAVPVGKEMESFGGTVILNDVSAFLLNNMKKDVSKEELISILRKEYDVDEETAVKDIDMITNKFFEIGLVEK